MKIAEKFNIPTKIKYDGNTYTKIKQNTTTT